MASGSRRDPRTTSHIAAQRRELELIRLKQLAAWVALGVLIHHPALADDPIRPDPRLTPGAVLTTDVSVICKPGYTKTVRHTSGNLKAQVYREYRINRNGGNYEIDHLIPLEVGGADVRENLWPESWDTEPWNAHVVACARVALAGIGIRTTNRCRV
jgi:hypothetical protein